MPEGFVKLEKTFQEIYSEIIESLIKDRIKNTGENS